MDILTRLALNRAGFSSLENFQEFSKLPMTGRLDTQVQTALEPWLLGYRTVTVEPGDTVAALARGAKIEERAVLAANPGLDPRNLRPGLRIILPLPFPVVPTDVPMTSRLCGLCIRGLVARYPGLCRRTLLTTTAGGRPVEALILGGGSRTVLYNAAHHANEWITAPVLLKFAEELAGAGSFGGEVFGISAAELLERTTVHLVPMVNPDGVDLVTGAISPGEPEYAQAEALAARYPAIPFPEGWKANLLGVDLNLNYPAGWENAREIKFSQGYTMPGPRDYVGEAPLDQRESAAMARYTRLLEPRLTLAYHSQGEVIYWRYLDMEPPGARAIGERFAEVSGYTLDDTPYASGFAGYKDWFILRWNRPGYTIEVGSGVNPLPLSQFDEIYDAKLGIPTLGMTETAPLA